MKIRSALVLGFALLYASTAFAQDDHTLEVTVNYSHVHANPQNNHVIPTFSLSGSHAAFRPAQFDYLLTRFGSAFTAGNNNQSNFRYQAGVQLRF